VEEGSEQAPTVFSELPIRRSSGHALTRRVRVWVHACRVVDALWDASSGRYVASGPGCSVGFVTEWLVLEDGEVAGGYCFVRPGDEDLSLDSLFAGRGMDAGEYVVFTAVEVAEKRLRHWVRLPWCNSLRVGAVRVVDERLAARDLRLVAGDAGQVTLAALSMPGDGEGEQERAIGDLLSWVVMMDMDGEGADEFDPLEWKAFLGLMIAGP
jgi:hypothetical protein